MKDIVISETAMDDAINVDKLDTDPNEQAKLRAALEAEHYRRNIMELDEFEHKYLKLFKHEAVAMEKSAYQELSQEYLHRIDPYYPVYVVRKIDSDRVSQLLRSDNVVYTLPQMFNRVGMVNNLGKDGVNIMQAFNNLATNEVDDRFNKKKEQYSKYLTLVFNNMNDDKTAANNRERAKAMYNAAINKSQSYKSNKGGQIKGPDVQDLTPEMLEELGVAEEVTNEKVSVVEEEEFL